MDSALRWLSSLGARAEASIDSFTVGDDNERLLHELRYLWGSDPGVLGHAISDMVGNKDEDLMSKDNAKSLMAVKKKALHTESAVRDLIELDVHGTNERHDLHVQPAIGGDGQLEGIACVLSAVHDTP